MSALMVSCLHSVTSDRILSLCRGNPSAFHAFICKLSSTLSSLPPEPSQTLSSHKQLIRKVKTAIGFLSFSGYFTSDQSNTFPASSSRAQRWGRRNPVCESLKTVSMKTNWTFSQFTTKTVMKYKVYGSMGGLQGSDFDWLDFRRIVIVL